MMYVVIEQNKNGAVKVLSQAFDSKKEAEIEASYLNHLDGVNSKVCTVEEVEPSWLEAA